MSYYLVIREGAIFWLIYHFLTFTYWITIVKNIFLCLHYSKLCWAFEKF